jgi:hypothetical protein
MEGRKMSSFAFRSSGVGFDEAAAAKKKMDSKLVSGCTELCTIVMERIFFEVRLCAIDLTSVLRESAECVQKT